MRTKADKKHLAHYIEGCRCEGCSEIRPILTKIKEGANRHTPVHQPRLNLFAITATIPDLEVIVRCLREMEKVEPVKAKREDIAACRKKYEGVVSRLRDYKRRFIDRRPA